MGLLPQMAEEAPGEGMPGDECFSLLRRMYAELPGLCPAQQSPPSAAETGGCDCADRRISELRAQYSHLRPVRLAAQGSCPMRGRRFGSQEARSPRPLGDGEDVLYALTSELSAQEVGLIEDMLRLELGRGLRAAGSREGDRAMFFISELRENDISQDYAVAVGSGEDLSCGLRTSRLLREPSHKRSEDRTVSKARRWKDKVKPRPTHSPLTCPRGTDSDSWARGGGAGRRPFCCQCSLRLRPVGCCFCCTSKSVRGAPHPMQARRGRGEGQTLQNPVARGRIKASPSMPEHGTPSRAKATRKRNSAPRTMATMPLMMPRSAMSNPGYLLSRWSPLRTSLLIPREAICGLCLTREPKSIIIRGRRVARTRVLISRTEVLVLKALPRS